MSYLRRSDKFKRAHVTSTPQRTGLDDGPPLPSPQALARAYAKIDAAIPRTDAERINYLEANKYVTIGIGHDGARFAYEIRIKEGGLKRFHGRTLRAAIDKAMTSQPSGVS